MLLQNLLDAAPNQVQVGVQAGEQWTTAVVLHTFREADNLRASISQM